MDCITIDNAVELSGYSKRVIEVAIERREIEVVWGKLVSLESFNKWMLRKWKEDKEFEEDYMSFDF